MKKIKNNDIISCDNCYKIMEFDTIEISFGYPSKFDEQTLDFCSDKCLKEWIIKNIKEDKNDNKRPI